MMKLKLCFKNIICFIPEGTNGLECFCQQLLVSFLFHPQCDSVCRGAVLSSSAFTEVT